MGACKRDLDGCEGGVRRCWVSGDMGYGVWGGERGCFKLENVRSDAKWDSFFLLLLEARFLKER